MKSELEIHFPYQGKTFLSPKPVPGLVEIADFKSTIHERHMFYDGTYTRGDSKTKHQALSAFFITIFFSPEDDLDARFVKALQHLAKLKGVTVPKEKF